MQGSGIDVIGECPWGTHFCQFYLDPQDLTDILVPYFKAGLESNEYCMWITSPPLTKEEAEAALRRAVPQLDWFLREGRIEILPHSSWHLAGGSFDTKRVLRGWVEKLEKARARGLDGLRVTGNTAWLKKKDWKAFTEYEEAINSVAGQHRLLALCTYSLEKCGAPEILDVVRNHQFALVKGERGWELLQGIGQEQRLRAGAIDVEHKNTHEILQKMNEDLERRVAERTEELRATNKALQIEIVRRQESQEALLEQGRLLEAFFQHSINPAVFLDRKFNFLRVNRAYADACRREISDFPGHNHFEFYPDAENQEIFENAIRTKEPHVVAGKPFVFPDHPEWGVTYWDWALVPILDVHGEVDSLFFSLRDVTKTKRAEEEACAASQYSRSLIEASLDPLVTISPEGKITDVNKATELATGVDRDHLIGSNFSDFFTEPQNANEGYQKVIRDGQVWDYPLTIRHVSGRTMDVLYNATVYRNQAGEVQGVFAAARDVTERKRMEQELRAASLYSRSLIEASLDPLVTISREGKITDVNEATELATGIDRKRLIGTDFSDYFTEPQKAKHGYQQVISDGFVKDYPLTIRHVSGRTVDVLYNATVYSNESGKDQGVFAAARDVTELRAAERRRNLTNALLELFATKDSSQEYLDAVVHTIQAWSGCDALGIRVVDGEKQIPYASCIGFDENFLKLENRLSLANDACICIRVCNQQREDQERSFTTTSGSFRCDDTPEFIKQLPQDQQKHYRGTCVRFGFASLAAIPIRYRDEVIGAIHLADKRATYFPPATTEFLESMAPLIGEAIHRFRAEAELGRYRDHLEELVRQRTAELQAANAHLQTEIAERERAEETLRETAEELARSNHDLEQFAYVASHDLQEPLRAVAGYAELLQRRYPDKLDEQARHLISGATDGAARMQKLITDLLTFSRVGTQGKRFELNDLGVLLNVALASLRFSIEEAGATITSDSLPWLQVDATQISQLFQNLIGNAIKFRGADPPQIRVSAEKQPGKWLFCVRDNGIGIDPRFAERIFLIFQRLHTRRSYPGTGIGLAICKRIVERHGGTICVESQPGQGSAFYFTIPEREEE